MENIFIDGMNWRNPHEKAPDFIKGCVSIDIKKFVEFARKHHTNGWINIDLKQSAKTGSLYFALNQFRKESQASAPVEKTIAPKNEPTDEIVVEEVPF
jgi:hypothetical protein